MTSSVAVDYKQLANAIIANSVNVVDPFTTSPVLAGEDQAHTAFLANGTTLMFGPYEVRPGLNQEVRLGRDYQPLDQPSISRLCGFLGRDEFSLIIRESAHDPERGLRPSRNGIWIKQPGEHQFRRLLPGEAVRITRYSEIRIGGNGRDAESGYPVHVV
jgi:hypothetical protein